METLDLNISVFFGKLWGVYYIVFGCLFVIANQLGRTIEMTDNKAFVIGTGYVTFFLGLVTIILHNIWVLDWHLTITLLGWVTFLKGIRKIGFPEQIHKQAQRFKKNQYLSASFLIIVGLYLIINAY